MENNYSNLDLSDHEFDYWLHRVSDLISETHQTIYDRPVFRNSSPADLYSLVNEELPETGQSMDTIMKDLKVKVIDQATMNAGPHFYSYVLSPGNQPGLLADYVASYLNQNTTKWHLNPAGAEIEKVTIRWIGSFINYSPDSTGILLSGGSMANLVCLNVARNAKVSQDLNKKGLAGMPPLTIYVSDQVHYCVDKSCAILGIGTDQVRRIPSKEDFTMDLKALKEQIEEDLEKGFKPFCIVGSAGTVNTGAIDPLEALAETCRHYNLWFHVDGAYGGPAAGVYPELFKGLELADSVAVDPHKWLYVPIESGCALFRDGKHLMNTYSFIPEYLQGDRKSERQDFMEYGPQLTRSFKALKTWVTIRYFGAARLRKAIEEDIKKTQYIFRKIKGMKDFEVLSPPSLSIICFRFNPGSAKTDKLNELNDRLIDQLENEGKVFITGTTIKGKRALRICIVNHRTQPEHLDYMLKTVQENARYLMDHA
jgi:glutamate/tyrosine decarboxylase-like PLP-dependent enzyme